LLDDTYQTTAPTKAAVTSFQVFPKAAKVWCYLKWS